MKKRKQGLSLLKIPREYTAQGAARQGEGEKEGEGGREEERAPEQAPGILLLVRLMLGA